VTHPLVRALGSPDGAERARACREAVDDPAAVLLLENLTDALGDPIPRVAMAAADAFAAIGARDGEWDERLRRSLRDGPPNARWAAAFAASQLAPPSARSLPALVEALACDDGAIRWRATRLLVDAAAVLPEVETLLMNFAIAAEAPPQTRCMALHALRALAPGAEEMERICLLAAGDASPFVRRAAASALAAFPGTATAARLLEMAEDDADEATAELAISALRSVGERDAPRLPAPTLETLRRIAEQSERPGRRKAARGALDRLESREGSHGEPERVPLKSKKIL